MVIESVRDIASRSRGVNFDWVSFEQNGAVFDYAAMVIRAREENSQKIITFQLDTGARGNQLYELALADQLGYPASQPKGNQQEHIDLALVFDGDVRQEINFTLRKNYGEQQVTSHEVPEIGTLALAFLGEDGFAIDYPNQRIYMLSVHDLDEIKFRHGEAVHSYATGFNNITGKIILPISIGGRKENAIFDTGSSMFEMTLPLDLWEMVTCSSITNADKKMVIESWGNIIEIFGAPTNATLNVAGKSIPVTDVYTWPTYDMLPVIGNKLFLNNLIVVDKCKQLFSVF